MKTKDLDPGIRKSIDRITNGLGLDPEADESLRTELFDHFEDAITQYQSEGLSKNEAILRAIQSFGSAGKVRRALKRTYLEVYLMTSIGKVIYSKPMIWTGMLLASLVALVTVIWGGAGVYELTKLPPSPTAWHDANTDSLFLLVFALPMFLLFTGSIVQWVRTKELPNKLVIFGVQAEDSLTFGESLTDSAKRGMKQVVNLALQEVLKSEVAQS